MYDAPPIALQRSQGIAHVALSGRGDVRRLYQQGCAKAIIPRTHGCEPEIVFLNTAGGVTGEDSLSYRVDLAAGAQATATTQTAERTYRAPERSAPGKIEFSANLGDTARLHWLPQETIVFDGTRVDRTTEISMPSSAELLMCETLVLGRVAMGERVCDLALTDRRRIIRDGVPFFTDPFAITGDQLRQNSAGAGVGEALVLALILLVAPGAEDRLGAVRDALGDAPFARATAWDDRLIVRAMGNDALSIRRCIARTLEILRQRAMPRVWQV